MLGFLLSRSDYFKLLSFWPPYLFAGVRVVAVSDDVRSIRVEMKLRFWNRNYVGTHFGGSLYSMLDPFYMLMVMENLGSSFIVWDKAATIRFKKPGKGKVFAEFKIDETTLEKIRTDVEQFGKTEPVFHVKIFDEGGDIVAECEKTLWVKKRKI